MVRYLTGDIITTIYGMPQLNMIFIETTYGMTVLYGNPTTLQSKAMQIDAINYPRHDRYGLVADSALYLYGNLTSYYKHPGESDGLWTGIYLSSVVFKYAVLKDNDTLNKEYHHLNAMSMLHNVTGIEGLVARSFAKMMDILVINGLILLQCHNGNGILIHQVMRFVLIFL